MMGASLTSTARVPVTKQEAGKWDLTVVSIAFPCQAISQCQVSCMHYLETQFSWYCSQRDGRSDCGSLLEWP